MSLKEDVVVIGIALAFGGALGLSCRNAIQEKQKVDVKPAVEQKVTSAVSVPELKAANGHNLTPL
jgi:hypothetical protein